MPKLYLVPRQQGGAILPGTPTGGGRLNRPGFPEFKAPEWQTQRISALRQQHAAPQVGRLKRAMSPWMIGGRGPESGQNIRSAMRGYGEGLSGIMGAAGQTALSQYGQEYAAEMRGAEVGFGAEMEEERIRRAEEEALRGREWETGERTGREEWQTGEAEAEREWQTGETEYERTGERRRPGSGFRPGVSAGVGFGRAKGGPVRPTAYSVGEGGTPSRPKPELVVYNGGRMELVGKRGPEVRTFPEEGQVIPAGKTKKILSRQHGGWVSGKENERLRKEVQRGQYRLQLKDIRSAGRGNVKGKSTQWVINQLKKAAAGGSKEAWMGLPYEPPPGASDRDRALKGFPNWYKDLMDERRWKIAMQVAG